MNSAAGAFFTPFDLSADVAIFTPTGRIIDLCAGIGSLAFGHVIRHQHYYQRTTPVDITCVELNPAYIEVGKKIVPEAQWIQADVLNLPNDVTGFDVAISNPPFGKIANESPHHRYKGAEFEYRVVEAASRIAKHGVFILPSGSVPFVYSGRPYLDRRSNAKYERFNKQTGINFIDPVGIDCDVYADQWKGVKVSVEVIDVDFETQT